MPSALVKEYESKKYEDEDGWKHQSIILKPLSTDSSYENIVLEEDDMKNRTQIYWTLFF